jgi:geranylgeranyl pyrophosphate synthase
MHAAHGMPIALNVGDLLLGDGYRLIGECTAAPDKVAAMLRVAANGHRNLCFGQGAELCWTSKRGPLKTNDVLSIFRQKTSPAFEVALQMGAILGGDSSIAAIISRFSAALGVAYQIRDDLDDLDGEDGADIMAQRPTLPLAVLYERVLNAKTDRATVEAAFLAQADEFDHTQIRRLIDSYEVLDRCRMLQESYKEEALRALSELKTPSLKGLLRRVVSKIFSLEVKGWCSEFETRNGASRAAGT